MSFRVFQRFRDWLWIAVNAVPPAACVLFIYLLSFSDPKLRFDSPILAGVALALARQGATKESAAVLALCCLLAAVWSFATGLPCLRFCLTRSCSLVRRLAIVVISMLLSAAISSYLLSRFPASSSMVDNIEFNHPTGATVAVSKRMDPFEEHMCNDSLNNGFLNGLSI